ncbi:MAG: hypothetical protein Ct9H90mP20_2870 [Candidatus Neomarinimicrobiota bacterium]|nr:MAG: hypothetical protein Ct9H90mP20_2870 [Candidatus Neomarinimicrobiota bacterium]
MVYKYGLERQIINIVDDINWIPDWGSDREKEWLNGMGDWMISKKRFWGFAFQFGSSRMIRFMFWVKRRIKAISC